MAKKKGKRRKIYRFGQNNEKGAVLIEFILAIPILFLMIWGIMNIMLYLNANSHLNQAAYEASRSIAKELRGYEGDKIKDNANLNLERVRNEVELIVRQNQFLSYGLKGHPVSYAYTKNECNKLYDDKKQDIFCAYIEKYTNGGKEHQNIVVKMRSSFQVIGGFVKNLEDYIRVSATSNAPQELADRLNYYQY